MSVGFDLSGPAHTNTDFVRSGSFMVNPLFRRRECSGQVINCLARFWLCCLCLGPVGCRMSFSGVCHGTLPPSSVSSYSASSSSFRPISSFSFTPPPFSLPPLFRLARPPFSSILCLIIYIIMRICMLLSMPKGTRDIYISMEKSLWEAFWSCRAHPFSFC